MENAVAKTNRLHENATKHLIFEIRRRIEAILEGQQECPSDEKYDNLFSNVLDLFDDLESLR